GTGRGLSRQSAKTFQPPAEPWASVPSIAVRLSARSSLRLWSSLWCIRGDGDECLWRSALQVLYGHGSGRECTGRGQPSSLQLPQIASAAGYLPSLTCG